MRLSSPLLRNGVCAARSKCFQPVFKPAQYSKSRVYSAVLDTPSRASPANTNGNQVRVRFAPSPTGNLHVGGARTALFNWLYAKKHGGKFILRVEDTDAARSTRASEEDMMRDLKWLGLDWDEGPDCPGEVGPYRQSERTELYLKLANQLVDQGLAYPCFCTDEELEAMKVDAAAKKLPPIYRGKWATASKEEVDEMKAKGVIPCYRFRVPKNKEIKIQDIVRGEVTWNSDTLGDFVLLRSNGLPVYNFCVAVDDCLMGITHVIRAEEHLPNTLRQVLVYEALGFAQPIFSHVSLILAPDKSKLSKRHGATSVGEFKEQGFLAPAMVNYLSLLGWNDGTEQEIFTVEELHQKFSLDRITKSPAVFDKTKLSWMNGQFLKALPEEEIVSMELITEGEGQLKDLLAYPLEEILATDEAKEIVADNIKEVGDAIIAAYESGGLMEAANGDGTFKKWMKDLGKAQTRKGKRLFMPARIILTGRMHGTDVGEQLKMLALENGDVTPETGYVPLAERIEKIKAWLATL
eukprot:gene30708-35735_t